MSRKKITDDLVKAAKKVADTLQDQRVRNKTESDLLQMLKQHQSEVDAGKRDGFSATRLSAILVNMKVDKEEQNKREQTPPPQVQPREYKSSSFRHPPPPPLSKMPPSSRFENKVQRIPLFGNETLGIFAVGGSKTLVSETLPLWKKLKEQELKQMVTHPATNVYEEMIQWTEQGKLWKYPINNEQGLEETSEAQVPFYNHIFMDEWMEGLPTKGPVRQFCEVMLLGLSRNPYITVERKKETFDWFKRYFEEKQEILKRSGALG